MSNWNALDEDSSSSSDIEPPPKTKKSRRNHHHHHPSTKHGHSINNQTRASTTSTGSINPSNNNNNGTSTFYCQASEQEYNDAKSVANHLSIPLHRVSFASEYWIQVFEPFVESIANASASSTSSAYGNNTITRQEEELEDGNKNCTTTTTTPNPDFECNTYIKFGAMKEYAMDRLEADYVATGHYARLWHRNDDLIDSISSSHQRNMHQCYGNSNNNSNNFYEWMKETSDALEQTVRESIAGRPEEEWILNNTNNTNLTHRSGGNNIIQYPMLIAGADRSKDQTYFLSGVKSEAFRNVLFPLGHLTKSSQTTTTGTNSNIEQHYDANNENNNRHPQQSVRDIATNANIPTASKRDSMGICFIGKRNFGNFVSQYLPEPAPPGNFVDVDTGEIVGRHEGAVYYTIGQGAKISGASARYFVCGKGGDMSSTVFVCNSTHHPALYTDELFVDFDAFNWIGLGESNKVKGSGGYYNNIPRPLLEEGASIELLARTRHLQPLASCRVSWDRSTTDGRGQQRLVVRFDKPMRAITPGQIVSLYAGNDGLICLGGGPIAGKSASFMDRGIDVSLSALHPSGHNDLSLGQYN